MKKTYVTSMPNHIGAFLKASRCFSALGINITRVSYNKAVDSHTLFIDADGTEEQLKKRKLHRARVSLGCMVLILAVGVVGNWYWENSDISTKISTVSAQRTKTLGEATFVDATTEAATENSYFTQAKLDRQSSRDAALEKLQKIVDTADKSAAAHKEAAQKIAKISDGINAENKIETLVTAKGVGQCLAIVSTDGKKVDVIVDSKDLSDALILQIKEIAVEQVGCDYKNVTIIQSK